jgi:hypothetical protein
MKWATIWAIEHKIAWSDMNVVPRCYNCPGEYNYYHMACTCKCPGNWVWPHEISDMLRLIRHGKYPDWSIKE